MSRRLECVTPNHQSLLVQFPSTLLFSVFSASCAARPVTMSINHITGGGGGLGSESAGTMRCSSGSFVDFSRLPITETPRTAQHCGPTAAVLLSSHVTRHLLSGYLPPPPKTTVAYICLVCPRRGLVTGACPGRGQMSSTGADDGRPYRACAMPVFSLSRPGSPCRGCHLRTSVNQLHI